MKENIATVSLSVWEGNRLNRRHRNLGDPYSAWVAIEKEDVDRAWFHKRR
jgi:hypothetical protein